MEMTRPPALPVEWTPIAVRPRFARPSSAVLTWSALPEAGLTIEQAHALAAEGVLVMASRHTETRVELVVRLARPVNRSP
jgi:hypothetical protein